MPDFSLKMHQIQFSLLGNSVLPDILAGFGVKGREKRKGRNRGRGEMGRGRRREEGRGKGRKR